MPVTGGTEHYAPGDLLVIDALAERRLSLSQTPYSTLVARIYSTQPGVVASQHPLAKLCPATKFHWRWSESFRARSSQRTGRLR